MTSRFGSIARGCSLAWAALIGTIAQPVRAQPEPVELTWRAPPGCPDRDAVLAKVRALLGVAPAARSSLSAEGNVVKTSEGFRLELVLREGTQAGERVLVARRCDDLAGAAAVALALLYSGGAAVEAASSAPPTTDATDPSGTTDPSSNLSAEAKAETTDAGTEREASKSVVASEGSPRSWRLLVDLPLGTLRFGPLATAELALGGGVGLEIADWSLRLIAQVSRSEDLSAERAGYGAEARLASAGLWGCRDLRAGALGVSGCVELGVRYLRARGYGRFVSPRTSQQFWPVAGLGALGFWQPLDRLSVLLGVTGELGFAEPRITLEEVGLVRQLGPTAATLFVTPEWKF